MGKASSNKKVARAASTGGGRTARGRTPVLWYSSLAVVVALGSLLIVTSRSERAASLDPTKQLPPRVGDHWHAAYGIHACGLTFPPLIEDRDPQGIHTHKAQSGSTGDGVIHIHPFTSKAAGRNATLGVFADAVGLDISETSFKIPGGKAYRTGDKCDGKDARVRYAVDGKEVKGDPRKIRFTKDRQLIMIAFLPPGDPIPEPVSKVNLDNLSDVPGAQQPPQSEIPGGTAPPGAPTDGSTPPSSAPPESAPSSSTPPTTGG